MANHPVKEKTNKIGPSKPKPIKSVSIVQIDNTASVSSKKLTTNKSSLMMISSIDENRRDGGSRNASIFLKTVSDVTKEHRYSKKTGFDDDVIEHVYINDEVQTGRTSFTNRKIDQHRIDARQERMLEENVRVQTFSRKVELFLSMVGYVIGLGNVWRFPYMVHKYGGGLFLIPYLIVLFCFAIPVFFLEVSLGQFTSLGPHDCWQFAKLFKGIGVAMIMISAITIIYFNVIIAWILYYMYASLTNELPWKKCKDPWKTSTCANTGHCKNGVFNKTDGLCRDKYGNISTLILPLRAEDLSHNVTLSADDYFKRWVLDYKPYDEAEIFDINWTLVFCSCISWALVGLCLSGGFKTSGKVVYFTSTFPYAIMILLSIHACSLDGWDDGIKYYFIPDMRHIGGGWRTLLDGNIWLDATVQLFFSLSITDGGLVNMASYNRFHHDFFRDTLMVVTINCVTSLMIGFVMFAYLGHHSYDMEVTIDKVVGKGPGFTFIIVPAALSEHAWGPFFCFMFFFMLFMLSLDTQFVLVDNVVLLSRYAMPNAKYPAVLVGVCVMGALTGVSFCVPFGLDLVELVDKYVSDWNSMFISLCCLLALGWVYGIDNYLDCMECMIGHHCYFGISWKWWRYWWKLNFKYITPIAMFAIIVSVFVNFKILGKLGDYEYPIAIIVSGFSVYSVVGHMIVYLCREKGTFKERVTKLTTPSPSWGPLFKKNRREWVLHYQPKFDVSLDTETKVRRSKIKDGMFDSTGVNTKINVVQLLISEYCEITKDVEQYLSGQKILVLDNKE